MNLATLRRFELPLLILLVLAFTLPFIGQAVHIDAHLYLDWAQQQLEHPWWQHLPDYDYFGVHYDEFHDTHPRLQSSYLSTLIWLTGSTAEPLLHLAMIPFAIMAVVSMYFLARSFGVNGLLASLILLVAPAFLVNTHLIMTDVPGMAFWLTGLVFFRMAVDREKKLWLILATLFFSGCIFIYYQGLSALPLALLYLVLKKRISVANLLPIIIPAILFAAYVSGHIARYDQLPTFSYPFGLPLDLYSVLARLRGVLVLLGGVLMLPGLGLYLFSRERKILLAAFAAGAVATLWGAALFLWGDFAGDTFLLLPLMLATGIGIALTVSWYWLESGWQFLKKGLGRERLFLATWFLGTLFYCGILLPYPSPRYMIPLIPPFAIFAVSELEKRWPRQRELLLRAIAIFVLPTVALSFLIGIAEHKRANTNREAAQWLEQNVFSENRTVWFNGGLGFQYYVERLKYRMLIMDSDEPQPGDLIVESVHNNRWPFSEALIDSVVLDQTVDFPRSWPLISEYFEERTSWLGQIGMLIPYGFGGDYVDRIYIYSVVRPIVEQADEEEAEESEEGGSGEGEQNETQNT